MPTGGSATGITTGGGGAPLGQGGATQPSAGSGNQVMTGAGGASAGTASGGATVGGMNGVAGQGTAGSSNPPAECGSGQYDAEVSLDGSTWTATNGGAEVYSGGDMRAAMQAAVDSLSAGRNDYESVVVRDSGTMDAGSSVNLASYTHFESCGTIDVTGSPGGDQAVIRGRGIENVRVPYLTATGGPYFGIFFRQSSNVHLGQIDLRLSGGLGVRIDSDPSNTGWGRENKVHDIRIDHIHVEGTDNHGLETYGVDGLTIGTVEVRNTAYAGVLLNATVNAEIGLVDAVDAALGSSYAAFRLANEAGRLTNFGSWSNVDFDTDYAHNIHVGEVRARGGGRGIFCVSGSGGAVIDRVDLEGVGTNPAVFIEDCYNVTLGAEGGRIDRGDASISHDVVITARGQNSSESTFMFYSAGIIVENLEITSSPISEGQCGAGPGTNRVRNNTLVDSSINVCDGTAENNN